MVQCIGRHRQRRILDDIGFILQIRLIACRNLLMCGFEAVAGATE